MEYKSNCKIQYFPTMGHCCIINEKRLSLRANEKQGSRTLKRSLFNDKEESTHYGGSFCIPEYKLMIKNSTSSMDVFGLGSDKNLEPILHFVLDENCACKLRKDGYFPSCVMPDNWVSYQTSCDIQMPHVLSGKKNKVIYVHYIYTR